MKRRTRVNGTNDDAKTVDVDDDKIVKELNLIKRRKRPKTRTMWKR